MKKKIVFLTGTRADFGKLKPLIEAARSNEQFEVHIFATGMHMDEKYGLTVNEIKKCGFDNIYQFINHNEESFMDITLAKTIDGFAKYIHQMQPDLIVVHGDRVEALAGATVGALNNILVAHIEGGELSGTVDELIRHAISKLSHTHFVANEDAMKRLIQMGELESSIYLIGSPDMDVMLSGKLPSWEFVKEKYELPFEDFGIAMFHPVTTEINSMEEYAESFVKTLENSQQNFIVIYPNNDKGSEFILSKLKRLENNHRFKLFPSVRFENFLVMMKHSNFIVGNSSAGIREAPYYGLPTVNVGSRQNRRTNNPDIIHVDYSEKEILNGIKKASQIEIEPKKLFGDGKSNEKFLNIILENKFWQIAKQKQFKDG